MRITVLLADNVAGIRKIEKALLAREPDIEVVGEAEDESEAVRLINSLRPQVVLTDFSVRPTGNVFSKQVKSQNPETKVLGVTELKGRYVRNFLGIFGADELLDQRELEGHLIATLMLVGRGRDRDSYSKKADPNMQEKLETLNAWVTRLEAEMHDEEARRYFLELPKHWLGDVERRALPGLAIMLPLIEQQLERAQDAVNKYGSGVRMQ
jgi:DNA-binding NarL/FixJ family response regulator